MTLKELLNESGASMSATLQGEDGVDYEFEFCVQDDEILCRTFASIAGHKMAVSVGRDFEMEMFKKLEKQLELDEEV